VFFILIWRFHSELCRIEDLPLSLHPQYPIQSLHTHQHRSLWPTKPLLPNDNCPAAPNGKDGASIPQLPGISNLQTPAQTLTPERLAPSFGSVVVKTVAHHLFKNSRFTTNLVQTDPAMTAPTFSNPEGPSGFDPELQAKFPEAYAFAVRVDQFGKNQIALLKVTMQPPKPSLFKEFAWLGRLLKKGTGHDLYTPGVHTEGFQPVAIKVEAILIEAWHNPRVQGSIQVIGGIAETTIGAGMTYASGGLAAPLGWVVMTHGLDHTITGCKAFISGEHVDSATQQLLQKSGMSHNAASTTDAALGFAGSLYGARSIGHAARGVERLATQSNVALSEQRSLVEAVGTPAYRSGFVGEKTAIKLAERDVRPISGRWVFTKTRGGLLINDRWYVEHALERMAPRTPEVMAELESRALERAANKGLKPRTEEFGKWMKKNGPDPRGIPPSVVEAEIANPGSTNIRVELNQKGDVITVIPRGEG